MVHISSKKRIHFVHLLKFIPASLLLNFGRSDKGVIVVILRPGQNGAVSTRLGHVSKTSRFFENRPQSSFLGNSRAANVGFFALLGDIFHQIHYLLIHQIGFGSSVSGRAEAS